MASSNSSLRIHELCRVAPPPSAAGYSHPLTFFDLLWLRFHPVERLFFYSIPHFQPSSFFHTTLPKLKRSLSHALQHFFPLAGNIVWPSNSPKPIVQYTPGDAVSLVIAVSDSDFNNLLDNSPREAVLSRPFVPHLESSDSSASLLSLQITLFPDSGFCIGISTHHACLDGKSSSMFMKAWAYLCQTEGEAESSCLLRQDLQPCLDREAIIDPCGLDVIYTEAWSGLDPTQKNQPSLKILSDMFPPLVDHSARAMFKLKRGDLEKIRKRVLQKWDIDEAKEEEVESTLSRPQTLSTFVLTTAYVLVCIAKAIERTEKRIEKLVFGFLVDCRSRLDPPVPENYCGNCVMSHIMEILPEEFTNEEGVVIVAKKIHEKTRKLLAEKKGALEGAETIFSQYSSLLHEGNEIQSVGVAGSNRFGVYETDFGWGKPEKVEIASADRNVTMAMAESKDGSGGVEVGLVLKWQVMDQFGSLFETAIGSL